MKILSLLLLVVIVVSCRPPQEETDYSQLESSSSINSSDLSDEEIQVIVNNARITCEQAASSGRLQIRTEQIVFPATRDCEFNETAKENEYWEINDQLNGPRKNDKVRAALIQQKLLDLPAGSTLCDMDFDFPTLTMKYDDEILLLLNNYVMFMSTDYSTRSSYEQYQEQGLKVNSQGLVEFKWLDRENSQNDLYNLKYGHNKAPRYCQGVPSDIDNYEQLCMIPPTQKEGQFKLDIPKSDIIKMGALKFDSTMPAHQLDFNFVSIGDNDDGDCEHDEFYFDVRLIYSDN